jgi:uncharacterized protein
VQAAGGPEWPATLDIPRLIASGWRPVPFREFVLKVHSRCDLSCDYCYVYTKDDQSWRRQPLTMSRTVADQAAARIAEHAAAHGLRSVRLILHGGEPLLAGRDLLGHVVGAVRAATGPGVRVDATVQSNGTSLDEPFLEFFREAGVRVGVSLDGDAAGQDRHRGYASGRGSHAVVDPAIRLLATERYRDLFGGLLCTVDVRNDPVATYEALLGYGPPAVDFLLPHGNWATPPPFRVPGAPDTPYGDWLAAVFDRWYHAPVRETSVRLFTEIMHGLLGGQSATESVGLSPVAVAVIEANGSIEQSDTLKSAYPGAQSTGLHIARDTLDDALLLPSIVARQIRAAALADQCHDCTVMRICGGGQYAHRYRPVTGFRNRSVYCPDLLRLIGHIRSTMKADVDAIRARRP